MLLTFAIFLACAEPGVHIQSRNISGEVDSVVLGSDDGRIVFNDAAASDELLDLLNDVYREGWSPSGVATLGIVRIRETPEDAIIVLHQSFAGVPVLSSEIVIVLDVSTYEVRSVIGRPRFLDENYCAGVTSFGASMAVSPDVRRCVIATADDVNVVLRDATTGEVVWRGQQISHYDGDHLADFRRSSFTANTTSDLEDTTGSAISSGARVNFDYVTPPDCRYHLSYQSSSARTIYYGITRVNDSNGGEWEIVEPCDWVPDFTASNGDSLREQDAFYFTYRNRGIAVADMFGVRQPERIGDLNAPLDVDFDNTTEVCGASSACFNKVWTTIYVREPNGVFFNGGNIPSFAIYAHEYGHYVNWQYGDTSLFCTKGDNEGNAISEGMAEAFALATGVKYWSAAYNVNWGRIGFGNGRHDTTSSIRSYSDNTHTNCDNGPYSFAEQWEQVVWELMHNVNCSLNVVACANDLMTSGTDIFGSDSQASATTKTLGLIAYAFDVTDQTPTYPQFAAQMVARAGSLYGTTVQANVKSVFNHHGYGL